MRNNTLGKLNIGKTLFALAMMICLTNTFTTTARADDWHDHEHNARDWHHRHMHRHDRPVIVREPNVVYAPPVVVQPSAVVEASSPGLNITVPINFR